MKAISLWEPWASLIRTGAKTWETRSWPTKYRGPLLICAAKGGLGKYDMISTLCLWDMQGGLAPLVGQPLDMTFKSWPGIGIEHLNFGKAVAVTMLVDCKKTADLTQGEIGLERGFGDFSLGRYAWKLKIHDNTFEPFPVKGSQGFFDVDVKCDCCDRAGEYNGFASGPTIFTCLKHCACHD